MNCHLFKVAHALDRLARKGATRDALAGVLMRTPVGIGGVMDATERRRTFVGALSHSLDWSPRLVERWRRICALAPRDFFNGRPTLCSSLEWSHSPCVCSHWRSAARHLLWVGGGLTLETFDANRVDSRQLMFTLYPPTAPEQLNASFARTTSGPLASEALALWSLGPWKVATLARNRLSRVPQAQWSPLLQEILVSATWSLEAPDRLAASLRRLPMETQLRVLARTQLRTDWARHNTSVLRSLETTDTWAWSDRVIEEAVETVLLVASTREDLLSPPLRPVTLAARHLLPLLDPRSGVVILSFISKNQVQWLPIGLMTTLLRHPEAEVREAALQGLATADPAGAQ